MKILGLYTSETLSLLRRVRAPFSVLAVRNHSFNLLQIEAFTNGITFSADVTVLSNWSLSESELEALEAAARQRAIVVDCDNPALLGDDLYRAQLACASLVTVPNEWMRSAIRGINTNVWVVPSCVDLPHFLAANSIKLASKRPICIGCLGPYDWYLVKDAVAQLLETHDRLTVIAGFQAFETFPKHPRILGINPTVQNLPEIIRNTHLGLLPTDGERGYDDIWKYEYGALCRPTIALASQDSKTWVDRVEALLSDRKLAKERGQEAFEEGNRHRATRLADKYLALYRKRLPHLFVC
jgi:hypothetical protein